QFDRAESALAFFNGLLSPTPTCPDSLFSKLPLSHSHRSAFSRFRPVDETLLFSNRPDELLPGKQLSKRKGETGCT
ncbi:hypothetical protein, partial [Azotobacter beijerinckii]|uniref:hypothetical protein n=1 Tax=Azotobacter beijerinckii TaxID=170623 RepID=UPI001B8D0A4A